MLNVNYFMLKYITCMFKRCVLSSIYGTAPNMALSGGKFVGSISLTADNQSGAMEMFVKT